MERCVPRPIRLALGLVLAGCSIAATAPAGELEPAPPGVDARAVAERAEETFRGDTNYVEATMTITSPRLPVPRVVRFRSWDDRPGKRAFIRILSPTKDAGTGFLMEHPNLWMYVPRVERTIRIPPSMMLQSWMGSDFTNDDLVRSSSQLDDYDHRLLGVDPEPEGANTGPAYVVEYLPHEDAPVVWGRIVSWIDSEHGTPLRSDFFDEEGARVRIIRLGDIRRVQERYFPHLWSMTPLHKEGHETKIEIETIRFDEAFDDSIFTTRNLKRRD
jgi:outer membrane lipoprotein-sorting protein